MIETIVVPYDNKLPIPMGEAQMFAEGSEPGMPYYIATPRRPRPKWSRFIPAVFFDRQWTMTMWTAYEGIGLPVRKASGQGRTQAAAARAMMRNMRPTPKGSALGTVRVINGSTYAFLIMLGLMVLCIAAAVGHARQVVIFLAGFIVYGLVVLLSDWPRRSVEKSPHFRERPSRNYQRRPFEGSGTSDETGEE